MQKRIGAFDQIAIIEEPFDEHLEIDIKDIPVRIAARISPFPGIGIGLLETNGHQNYRNWDIMKGYNPYY